MSLDTTEAAMKAIAYYRVSSEEQAESGLGIEAQRQACRDWASEHDAKIIHEHTDEGVSGTVEPAKRDELAKALNGIDKVDRLLVAKRDRVARDMVHAGMVERMVEKAGAELVSVEGEGTQTDDPMAAFFQKRMSDLFAEYEALQASVRTKAALEVKRQRGEYTGGDVPFGKRLADDGVHLEDDPHEQEALQIIQKFREDGQTLAEVANALEARGVSRRNGNSWHKQAVSRALKSASSEGAK